MNNKRENLFVATFITALLGSFLAASLFSASLSFASLSSNVLASANVLYTLYTSVSPNAINLGNVNPNYNATTTNNIPTNNLVTVYDVNGNIGANVFVVGTNFIYGSNIIYVTNTL
ncbi:MAG: hypothetical protein ACP5T4_03195, partial [Candidatus Micrarchaeia archaeon]